MSSLYLVRHGQRVSRDENTVLNDTGILQAHTTGKALLQKNITRIFVSPAHRTIQTADILNEYLKVPILQDNRLLERMVYEPRVAGEFSTFLEEWDKTMASRDYLPPYGDSARTAGNRMIQLLEECDTHENILCVSHGGIIGDVLRNLFEDSSLPPLMQDLEKQLSWLHIPECSISEIEKTGTGYVLHRVADVQHLEKC